MGRIKVTLVLAVLAASAVLCLGRIGLHTAPALAQSSSQLSTWQSRDYGGVRYVGSGACARCHKAEAETQFATPMAHALEPAAGCGLLARVGRLTFTNGPYVYSLNGAGGRPVYAVTDGKRAISEPVLYCFGQGEVGQTYVFRHDGQLYETRVSYYRGIRGLDFTVGHPHTASSSLDDALGRPIGREEAQACVGCHAPEAVGREGLRSEGFSPSITCEGCHGPGEKHVAVAARKDLRDPQIFNPGGLNGLELSQEFCGSCHVGFEKAMLMTGQGGVNNIRFQAYRIFNSPGHRGGDPRISCVACHNPHRNVERAAASYDSKCLACHVSDVKEAKTKERTADACPVAKTECVKCHMPKAEIPGMHAEFTDHWIRTVRPGDKVPR
jgi:hypothetical protein